MSPLLLLHFVTLIVVLLNKPFKTSFLYLLCREKQNIDLFIVQFVISISIFCNIMPKTIILANLTQKIVNIGNGKTIFEHSVNRFRNCRQKFLCNICLCCGIFYRFIKRSDFEVWTSKWPLSMRLVQFLWKGFSCIWSRQHFNLTILWKC